MHSASTMTTVADPASPPAGVDISLRIGTRGSALARRQAETVVRLLSRLYPGCTVQTEIVSTEGDLDKVSPLTQIGGRGVFTSALQRALLDGSIDAAVHSAKDLPSLEPPGVELVAFPEREDPRDVVVSRHGVGLDALPANPTVGTSSRRRAAQIRALRPDARIVELRGNIDTRLRRALDSDFDAIILAAAGVMRMGWVDRIAAYLPVEHFTPAPGQGALAVETRGAPDPAAAMVRAINDGGLAAAVAIERAFLRGVGGGCTTPIGAYAVPEPTSNGEAPAFRFYAMLASDDGTRLERAVETVAPEGGEEIAFDLARRLMQAVRPRYHVRTIEPARPLAGLTVLVTRQRERAAGLVDALEAAGALPVVMPAIAIKPVADETPLVEAARRLSAGEYDWMVVTSANAVQPLSRALSIAGEAAVKCRVAAIGAATVAALKDAGFAVDMVPAEASAAGLVAALRSTGIEGARILCPQGNLARPTLVDGLRRVRATVETVVAYRTEPSGEAQPAVQRLAHEGQFDV
ncbi:MAG: hydroxymethylbilane synthase, partial [Chloroflexota bacterium]|nr:hydroxymethylbilane synthase [Chloroflexota bacterium]